MTSAMRGPRRQSAAQVRRFASSASDWIWPDDAGIPRGRIACGKRVREDLVNRLLGGETRLSIAGFINDSVDCYDRRDAGCDAVAIFDCGSCVSMILP